VALRRVAVDAVGDDLRTVAVRVHAKHGAHYLGLGGGDTENRLRDRGLETLGGAGLLRAVREAPDVVVSVAPSAEVAARSRPEEGCVAGAGNSLAAFARGAEAAKAVHDFVLVGVEAQLLTRQVEPHPHARVDDLAE